MFDEICQVHNALVEYQERNGLRNFYRENLGGYPIPPKIAKFDMIPFLTWAHENLDAFYAIKKGLGL